MQGLKQKEIRELINDYEFTCHTIVAFENIVSFNIAGKCVQGKGMKTSASNEIQPNTDVTPDVVIEAPHNSDEYHAVNEITVDMSKDDSHWLKKARQLKKYDDDLTGWDKASSKPHDIMLTTNPARTYGFNNYMSKLKSENKLEIKRPFSILQSTPMEQQNSFIFIKKEYGIISHPVLDNKLSNGLPVARYNINNEINQMKFFDSNPPIVYTMMIIWDHILKNFLDLKQIRELRGNKIVPIEVTVQKVHELLSKFAPQTNPNCIETSWVRDALSGFVEIGLAEMKSQSEGRFEVKFRTHKGKTLNWLFDRIKKPEPKPTTTLDKFIEKKPEKDKKPDTEQTEK
jgi:hypothetical protein